MPAIYAPLTPVQVSPVIVLRVSGMDIQNVFKLFSISNIIQRQATRTKFKSIINPLITDDVILIYYKQPNSYTGEDVIEISFHGNPIIVQTAMCDLDNMGLRLAEAGEFTKRAYLSQKITLMQAEAIDALIHSTTASGVHTGYNTLAGKLDAKLLSVRNELIKELASIEAAIDFFEDDYNINFNIIENALELLRGFIDSYRAGRIAVNGVNAVIIGEPNAGKSTIFNTLLNEERAIVTDEAGTTRDILTETINNNGITYKISDTAGIRETKSIAESIGIERSYASIDLADLVILVVDLSMPVNDNTTKLFKLVQNKNHIIIGSKADADNNLINFADIKVSVKNRTNITELRNLIQKKVLELMPKLTDISIFTERHYQNSTKAVSHLNDLLADRYITLDIAAYYLRNTVKSLNALSGNDVSEETLDIIFKSFCIGK